MARNRTNKSDRKKKYRNDCMSKVTPELEERILKSIGNFSQGFRCTRDRQPRNWKL